VFVPTDCYEDRCDMNLASIIDAHDADRVALISRGQNTTYGDLRHRSGQLRALMVTHGVKRGDRVALLCANDPSFAFAYLAILGAGAIAVPLNPSNPSPALAHEIAAVGAIAVVVGPTAADAWNGIDRSHVPTVDAVFALAELNIARAVALEDADGLDAAPLVDVEPSELAVLLFTSGTAGAPRAAMLSHGNLMANLRQANVGAAGLRPEDVIYGVLPLHHIFGLNVVLGGALFIGATAILVQRFDPVTALETIVERKVTVIPGAPPLWSSFVHFTEAPADSFVSVRLALTGAAKMSEDHARQLQQRFGITLREGYGLTEASPVVTTSVGVDAVIGSIGLPLPGIAVRLVDEDGDDALVGDAGEIWVKGDNVFSGYWLDPEATARALTPDGWLRTGDIAVMDDDGRLFIVDRAKDLIIVSGFNVYPAEVEDVISSMPEVAEVAVVGVAHPHTGEAVKAFVVAAQGRTVDEDRVISFCADELARYKCPSKVLVVDELPRNATGKVLRRVLR
jgi:long-chain acyl-CoA synthetase